MLCCCAAEETPMAEVASTAVLEENRFTEGRFASPAATVEVGIFDVALKIPELNMSQLGLEIDVTDERGLVVANIGEGLFQRFNELYPTQALRVYDKILMANDVKHAAEIYKTMKSSLNEKKDGGNMWTITGHRCRFKCSRIGSKCAERVSRPKQHSP
eukprot:s1230_g5.t1